MAGSIKEAWELAKQKLSRRKSPTEHGISCSVGLGGGRSGPPEAQLVEDLRARVADRTITEPTCMVPPQPLILGVSENAKCRIDSSLGKTPLLPESFEEGGRRLQVRNEDHRDERDLILGLDFGTSCTKAVIGDRAAGQSFAVPLLTTAGIDRYLLASRIYETDGEYSLVQGRHVHRDLKLSLMERGGGDEAERKVVAYLALVIRRTRGWLLNHHHDIYRDTRIHWTLALGLPARQNFDSAIKDRFERIALAAWCVAGADGKVSRQSVDRELIRAVREGAESTEVEVKVIPEIAAQIYGFVVSDSFDPKGNNIFLIADIGAGTVDASLFYVNKARGGKYNFSFYTSTVDYHGVANLHRHRIEWWDAMLKQVANVSSLHEDLKKTIGTTDHDLRIPESYRDYFSGIEVDSSSEQSPDDGFFRMVSRQVVRDTFHGAVTGRQVPAIQLKQVPFYLCGGGARMNYYMRLGKCLEIKSSASDITARVTPLTVPGNLTMAGVPAMDYDRLSVAYGLAWLEPGWVVATDPMRPLNDAVVRQGWRENYVDKDQM